MLDKTTKGTGTEVAHQPKRRGRPTNMELRAARDGVLTTMKEQIELLDGRLKELAPLVPLLELPPKMRRELRSIPHLPKESLETVYQVMRNIRRKPGRPWRE